MVKVISRGSPNDKFFFSVFESCLKIIPDSADVYYVWSDPLSALESIMPKTFNSSNVFIFMPDDLSDRNFLYGTQTHSWGAELLIRLAKSNPTINFTIISDIVKLDTELQEIDNLQAISCEFMGLLEDEYKLIEPILDKNFQTNKSTIFMAGSPTRIRISMMSCLYGLGYDNNIEILTGEFIGNSLSNCDEFLDLVNWNFDQNHETTIKPILVQGYKKLRELHKDSKGFGMSSLAMIPCENFVRNHQSVYRNSFVELLSETYYEEPSFMITEKMVNCFYGCNFPLILSSAGTVDHLRTLGFDMFDDVIDHSYDKIKNPVDRLVATVELNQRLLTDAEYAKSTWVGCQDRFYKNVKYLKTEFHNMVRKRVHDSLNDVILKHSL